MKGNVHPRVGTPGGGPTYGPQVTAITSKLRLAGQPFALDPWQQLAVNRMLRHDGQGNFVHDQVGIVVARGNGKSTLLAARVLWGMLTRGERVLGTAQNLPTAEIVMTMVIDALRSIDEQLGRDPERAGSWWSRNVVRHDRSRGSKALELANGGTYMIRSHRRAARGTRAHLLLVDEVREWAGEGGLEAWGATVGVTAGLGLARNTQVIATSNAGDVNSLLLNHLRDQGRAAAAAGDPASPLCWLEWSAGPDRDLHDPLGWAEANPALGIRVRPDQLAARAAADPPGVFRTEHLSQWVSVMDAAVNAREWEACLRPVPLQRDWPASIGVELSFDRQHAAVVLASTDPEGVAHLRLLHAEHRPDGGVDTSALATLVRQLWDSAGGGTIHLDPRSAGPLVDKLKIAFGNPQQVIQLIGPGRLSGATGELLARVQSRRLAHDGDPLLAEHVLSAGVRVSGDGGLVLSRKSSTGPIAAAVAAALAVNGAGQLVYEAPMIYV